MKFKLSHVVITLAIILLFTASSTAVIRFILNNRNVASTQLARAALYDPTPGIYARRTRLEFYSEPQRLQAGQTAIWSVKIVDEKEKDRHGQPKYVRSFVQQGGNLINLIVVSDDLSFFKRYAPEYKDYGHFLLQTSLPSAGTYRLYADYIPYEGRREVKQQTLEVGGTSQDLPTQTATPQTAAPVSGATAQQFSTQRVRVQADEGQGSASAVYQVELRTSQLEAKRKTQLQFTVRDAAGNAVVNMEPYFGAQAQCVAISRDGQTYLHPELKADVRNDQGIVFETQFPRAGSYKVWLQLKPRNVLATTAAARTAVVTAAFTITIVDAAASGVAKTTANNPSVQKG